jgi:hypothetical protein
MRLAVALALCLGGVLYAQTGSIEEAKEEADRIRTLVEAGALPRVRLDEAQELLAKAEDEETLARTLYGSLQVEDLTEEQADQMLAAARRRFAAEQARLEKARKLVDEGVAPRTSVWTALEDLDRARRTVDLAESRARLFLDLVEMARAEEEAARENAEEQPLVASEKFSGSGYFTPAQMRSITLAFEKQFARALPVSARGQTALHRSLGFDHRGRIDVAIHPDQNEGVWLRRYLEAGNIPYFAFRRAIPGKATAAHIHIGPPSGRYRAAD